MTNAFEQLRARLADEPRTWLVTGVGGFVASHIAATLLEWGQRVRGVDNFVTGRRSNLEAIRAQVGDEAYARFEFLEADVVDLEAMTRAASGADHVVHQAAIGSVPRSIEDPAFTFRNNVIGTFHMLEATRAAGVKSFVFASSSSVYGDHPALPKREAEVGLVLSPYAASKAAGEAHIAAYSSAMGLRAVGLRYFNVIGSRQDPDGPYAAVVPRWVAEFAAGRRPKIFGDGETSRDFCPVANVVQANLLAAFAPDDALGHVFNVALGRRTTLNELFDMIRDGMVELGSPCEGMTPDYEDFRPGDIRHSHADISAIVDALGYAPTVGVDEALRDAMRGHLEAEGAS